MKNKYQLSHGGYLTLNGISLARFGSIAEGNKVMALITKGQIVDDSLEYADGLLTDIKKVLDHKLEIQPNSAFHSIITKYLEKRQKEQKR